ncbi:MAG: ABC transporter permease, partial [Clostridia bacterium]|nr:ABC transporter permease [Clostridia bacterium]
MKFTQAIKMAVTSILSNRMRSFLTMLGIIIGISSVIILIAVGNGSKQAVTEAIEGMGTNLLTVNLTSNSAKSLTATEISTIKKISTVADVAQQITGTATAKVGTETYTTSIVGTESSYEDIKDVHTALGRFITQDDIDNRYKVVDVGIEVLQNIYPDMDASEYDTLIGTKFQLNGTNFEIAGILESKGTSSSGSNDNIVIMPLSTAERFLKSTTVKTYYVSAKTSDDVTTASTALSNYLYTKYEDTSYYRVLSQSELLSTTTSTTNSLTMMLAGIAAISLIVGGIGIMNIMLVSVIERTREIGIRKAIGAKRRDIMLQFLIEAVFLSCVGGIVGVGVGLLGYLILPRVTSLTLTLSVPVM